MKTTFAKYVCSAVLIFSFLIPTSAGAYTQADIDIMFSTVQSLLAQVAQLIANGNNLADVSTGACSISVFAAGKPSIASGSTTAVYWEASSTCTAGKLKGGIFGSEGLSVSRVGEKNTGPLTKSTTYTLSFGSVSKSVTVKVASIGEQVPKDSSPVLPTITLSASPTSITLGQSSTLTWSSTNATSCTASNGWSGTKAVSGSQNISPEKNTTYTLACNGAGGSISKSVTVSLKSTPVPIPTVTLSASPASISAGQNATLTWSTTDATSCTASNGWSGTKATSGSESVAPTSNTNYTLTCSGIGGSANQSASVSVTTAPAPTLTLTGNPTSITAGQSATLTWSSTNTTSCSASNGWTGTKATSGTQNVSPTVNTNYTLTCSGIGGSATQSVNVALVTVTPPPPPPAGGAILTPSALLPAYGPLVAKKTTSVIPELATFDSRFLQYEQKHYSNYLVDIGQGSGVAVGYNHYGFLGSRLSYAIRAGLPYGAGVTDDTKDMYARGRRVVIDWLQMYSVPNNYAVAQWQDTSLEDIEALAVLENNQIARTHIHMRAAGGTSNSSYWKLAAPQSDPRGVTLALQPMLIAHRLGIPYSRPGNGYQGSFDPSLGSWAAAAKRNIYWLDQYNLIKSDGTLLSPAHGNVEAYFMNAMLVNQLLGYYAYIERDPKIFAMAQRVVEHWINVLPVGWDTLPYQSANTSTGSSNSPADDLASFYVYPSLVMWQETGDQKYYDFAIKNIRAANKAYAAGYKQFNQMYNTDAFAAEAIIAGIPWKPANPTFPPAGPIVVPPPPATTPTITFTASPASISAGQSATLTWSSTNTTSCSASNGWTGTKTTSGTQSVSPTIATTYTITCMGAGGSATQNATVSVGTVVPPPPPVNNKFNVGDAVQTIANLNVRITAAGSLLGQQPLGSLGKIVSGPVVTQSTNEINNWWNVDYVNAPDGWSIEGYLTKTNVTPPPPSGTTTPTITFTASPASITAGQSATLTWSSTNTTSCSASNGWTGTKTTSGTQSVSPTIATTYTITCTGAGGSVTKNVVVSMSAVTGPVTLPIQPLIFQVPMPTQTGKLWTIPAGDSTAFQAALNQAQLGDTIELAAGSTYTGNFTFPKKTSGTGWIVVRTNKYTSLPPTGVRVGPSDAINMAKIVSTNTGNTLSFPSGSHHYRLIGLDVTNSISNTSYIQTAIISIDPGSSSNSVDLPNNITLDRMYVHSQPSTGVQRCVRVDGAYVAVIDSYLSECHAKGFDSQAIAGWNTNGPIKIVNNMLEGAGENVMFGGADPTIQGAIPSDIEIRNNHIYTPVAWKGTGGATLWSKKNLFEIKAGKRILVEGNVFDGSWSDGQVGHAILLRSTNQGGKCVWCQTTDFTARYNVVRNVGGTGNISGNAGSSNVYKIGGLTSRVLFEHNLFQNINVAPYTGVARLIELYNNAQDVTYRNNTWDTMGGTIQHYITGGNSPTATNFTYVDNIAPFGQYGVVPGYTEATLKAAVAGIYNYSGNVVYSNQPSNGYSTTKYPTTPLYSNYSTALSAGKGADIPAVLAVTKNAVSGNGMGTTPPPLSIGSTPVYAVANNPAVLGESTTGLSFARTLVKGMEGGDVIRLQEILRSLGLFTEEPTGYFGTLTEQAVQKFQVINSIVSVGTPQTTGYGIVGPKTQQKLIELDN